ncbi:amino acid ABC transporter permease [Cupriavidus sp. CV2]|uniref:amino acid ABC transporter permease n=1 Tax=Cupriavidus ulmosensis TaxID=3065913 RepID=UPI00296A9EC7|nr:amino acid ABC transporter permease [Cupriavidus sp. CV2]MDW3686008.1 amino acid ABC transporter permease [Cupriavidus sp. CV2]
MKPFGLGEFTYLLLGLRWTVLLSLMGFVGGSLAGLAIALARTSDNSVLRRASAAWIALFQGTPLLLQLFVVYYGVALMNISIDPWFAVAIGLTLHASAFLGEIWRGAIQSLNKGQIEAARALGIRYWVRMRHVVLPQALKISLPATVGFLVQLLKGTSLAAIVGFTELTRAGSIVSNQTYRPLLIFGVVGVLYFMMCWPLSIYGSKLERRLGVGR